MFKRILVLILSVTVACLGLVGCSLFTFDSERDLQRVIAVVNSYTIENSVVTTEYNDEKQEDEEVTRIVSHTTEAKTIYKRDLIEYVNSNASSFSSSFGSDLEGMYKYASRMLISLELVSNEVDALIACGKVEWGVEQQNEVKKSLYTIIDNSINQFKNDILSERGMEPIVYDNEDAASSDTTYPVKPEQSDSVTDEDVGYEPQQKEVWQPPKAKYPGLIGDSEERSLGRSAMRRFLALIKNRVSDDFRISSAERKAIDAEIKAIDNIIDTQGLEYVYPVIGNYPLTEDSPFGHIMYYISGKTLERSQKITTLQKYLGESATVSDAEVVSSYTAKLNEQKSRFTADVSAFDSAMNGTDPVLYYPNNNYFYVKHILLPFSDAQKDDLTAFKEKPELAHLSKKEKENKINAYRDSLVESIVCYPHKDGEDDLTKPMSVNEVMAHIRSVMLPLEADVAQADVAFDDLIYLYNTDPGAFNNNKGYVVKYKLDDGESERYMQEFADGAREMRDSLNVGQVYYKPVVTDYGVHIMYLASVTQSGEVGLYSYTTPGRLEKYYDLIAEPIRTARSNNMYQKWENNVLSYNYNDPKIVKQYTENYSNLWKK